MIITRKTWWFSTPVIALCFALWFLIIPGILGFVLIYHQYQYSKTLKADLEKLTLISNLDNEITSKETIITDIKEATRSQALIQSNEIIAAAQAKAEKANDTLILQLKEKNKKLTTKESLLSEEKIEIEKQRATILDDATKDLYYLNEKITEQKNQINDNDFELTNLKKEIQKYIRQARKFRSDAIGLKYIKENIGLIDVNYNNSYTHRFSETYDETVEAINNLSHNELLKTVSTLYLHSDHSRNLRSLSRATKKEIERSLSVFLERYQTKTIKALYNLMVIGLQSEIQLILANLSYETLDESLEKVNQLIEKYLIISSKGNQIILPTVTRFLSTVQEYYKELVHIEYRYYTKREQEKEEQRLLREQMRQEAAERKALKAEEAKLKREETKFKAELNRTNEMLLMETDDTKLNQLKERILELEEQMNSIEERKESIATLANGKAGYVYIISNVGSFGNEIFKIGMTRRLEPQDRIDELGSASVPFRFDIHAFIFSEDAVGLEKKLHQQLSDSRVNKVNFRKEFFRTSLDHLEQLVEDYDPTAEFNETILALEYKQTLAIEKQSKEVAVV